MEWGSVADWFSAAGGVLAVIAAFVAWRVSSKLLAIEQQRDGHTRAAAHRAQAELVFAIGAVLPDRGEGAQWAIYLVNASSKPVFDVRVESQKLDGSKRNPTLRLGALPPGKFVVPSHAQFHWGVLLDYERIDEPMELLLRGKGNQMILSVDFLDATRERWRLAHGTEIDERGDLDDQAQASVP